MGKRKGKSLKKNHAFDESDTPEMLNKPHSFVIHRGLPCPNMTLLSKDFRQMMEPFTASSLREKRSNKIKDFVSLSAMFHVSHMCVFNKSATQLSFKAARLPKGPTLNFKIHQFTLARDVMASMKKQYYNDTAFKHSPLVRRIPSFWQIKRRFCIDFFLHSIYISTGDFEQFHWRRESHEVDGKYISKYVSIHQFGNGEFVNNQKMCFIFV